MHRLKSAVEMHTEMRNREIERAHSRAARFALTCLGVIVLIIAAIAFTAKAAHAADILDVKVGATTTRYAGSLTTRTERADGGVIYFSASSATPLVKMRGAGIMTAGIAVSYDVSVTPLSGSGINYLAQDCGLISAEYEHWTGVTYLSIECAP